MKKRTFFLSVILSSLFSLSALAIPLDDASDLFKKKDYWKSIEILDKVIKDEPENPEPYLLMSKCYEALFQLDKSMFYFQKYDKLKQQKIKKDKLIEKEKNKESVTTEPVENYGQDSTPSQKGILITYINDDFISDIITQRTELDKNRKYLNFKEIKKIFSKIPLDTEDLEDFNLILQIKENYGLLNYQDNVLLLKSDADLISFEIDEKNNSNENGSNKEVLDKLVLKYNKKLEELKNILINPVTNENSPLSYEKYLELKSNPDDHIKYLETKKNDFITSYLSSTEQIKKLKNSIIADEKDLKKKKESIPDKLLEVSKDDLIDIEKQKVIAYLELKQKVDSDKKILLNFLSEQNILFEAINISNDTIKKINPSYKNNDPKLPDPEVLKKVDNN
jgi:hypothetical protein